MMKEQMSNMVCTLEEVLETQTRLMDQLFDDSQKAETALINNDIETLKTAIESQEDISLLFAEKERVRVQQVQMLIEQLHIGNQNASLKEIARQIPDPLHAGKLEQIGNHLARSVARTQGKNKAVREILALKSEYVDTMLGLLCGHRNAGGQGYNAHGSLTKSYDHGGIYEVLI